MARPKKRFTYQERYAVWECNERRCWYCERPLRVLESTVDHVFPESLLWKEQECKEAFEEFSLPRDFNINGFENWLPCHSDCNQKMGARILRYTPKLDDIVQNLIRQAHWVERTASKVKEDVTKDKILQSLFSALDNQKLTLRDIEEFLDLIVHEPELAGVCQRRSKSLPDGGVKVGHFGSVVFNPAFS